MSSPLSNRRSAGERAYFFPLLIQSHHASEAPHSTRSFSYVEPRGVRASGFRCQPRHFAKARIPPNRAGTLLLKARGTRLHTSKLHWSAGVHSRLSGLAKTQELSKPEMPHARSSNYRKELLSPW